MKKIIIIGARKRDTLEDYSQVWDEFRKWYDEGDIIVSGGAKRGGDRFAEMIAKKLDLTEENGKLIIHRVKRPRGRVDLKEFARAAYERNTLIANEVEKNSIVIACVSPDRVGGTEDTIRKVRRRNILKSENQIRIV
jgi:hypothetical protein